jgi:hypothetical protein
MLYDPKYDLDETGHVLWKAAEYLEEYGWIQGTGFSDRYLTRPAACAMGAIEMAANASTKSYDLLWVSAMDRMQNYLHGERIHSWNDAEGRTKEEVIDTLRQAATAQS